MLNRAILMGRLTADPELRKTQNGTSVTSFTLAVNRSYTRSGEQPQTDFIDIVAWRSTAEFVSKYFAKGRMAVVSGRLQIRRWQDKDGNNRRSAEVVADNVYFGDSKRDNADGGFNQSYGGGQASYGGNSSYGGGQGGGYRAQQSAPAPANDFAMLEDDDSELPF